MIDTNSKPKSLLTRDEKRLALLKVQEVRDKLFKLIAKVISWETGALDSIAVKSLNKITKQEWLTYKKHILGITTSESIEKVKEKLNQTYKDIKKNNGFK